MGRQGKHEKGNFERLWMTKLVFIKKEDKKAFLKSTEEQLLFTKKEDISSKTRTYGHPSLGERNEAEPRLSNFCIENEFVTTNTLFEQPKMRLYTWTSPDGNNRK